MFARGFALSALAVLCVTCGTPARAVDRSLGAAIAKPAATGAAWTAAAIGRLHRDIDALLDNAPTLRGAHAGLLVRDTRTGLELYARHADDAFVPASTFKLLTGSVALATLGPAFRFQTQALLDAPSMLYVRGGGDPLLRAGDLDGLPAAIGAAGGNGLLTVRIDATAFERAPYPPGWSWDDFVYDYAPVVSALSIEENVVHLTVTPGARVGAPVRISGAPAPFEQVDAPNGSCANNAPVVVLGQATTAQRGAPDDLDIERSGGCIVVTGSLGLGRSPESIDAAVADPGWYAKAIVAHRLAGGGLKTVPPVATAAGEAVDAGGRVPGSARIVWAHDSEPLTDLLADTWWPSDNLAAELLLRAVGRYAGGAPGTTANGAAAERDWLSRIGVDPQTVTIADGSGLSSYDRITPRALVAILQADWNGPYRERIIDDLPLAGVRGTLATSFAGTPAERRTFAKTGSVNHTRGLAGYLAPLHHGALTFAWSVDDWQGADADLAALRARVLSRLIGD